MLRHGDVLGGAGARQHVQRERRAVADAQPPQQHRARVLGAVALQKLTICLSLSLPQSICPYVYLSMPVSIYATYPSTLLPHMRDHLAAVDERDVRVQVRLQLEADEVPQLLDGARLQVDADVEPLACRSLYLILNSAPQRQIQTLSCDCLHVRVILLI